MAKLTLILQDPARTIRVEHLDQILLPTKEGPVALSPHYAFMIFGLQEEGDITLLPQSTISYRVHGGIAEIKDNICHVCTPLLSLHPHPSNV